MCAWRGVAVHGRAGGRDIKKSLILSILNTGPPLLLTKDSRLKAKAALVARARLNRLCCGALCTASGAEQTTRGPTTALAVPILLLLVPFRPPGTGPVGEGKHRRARDGCN